MDPKKIFVSYSRADAADFALRVSEDLQNAGADIWIDQIDIDGGKRWDVEIETALKSADCVLFIVSEKSVSSNNVLDEVHYALDERKQVIPVIFKKYPIPYRIRRLHQVDFTASYEKGIARLYKDLDLTAPVTSSVKTENNNVTPTTKRSFQRLAAYLAVVGILVVVIAVMIFSRYSKSPGPGAGGIVLPVDTLEKSVPSDSLAGAKITRSYASKIMAAKILYDNGSVAEALEKLYTGNRILLNDNSDTLVSCPTTDDSCLYASGMEFYSRHQYIPAIGLFSIAQEQNAKASCMLGNMYYSGYWVKKNLTEAHAWYKKAADQNNSVALLMMGIFSMEGTVIKKNVTKAKIYFQKVIENNDNDEAKKLAKSKIESI